MKVQDKMRMWRSKFVNEHTMQVHRTFFLLFWPTSEERHLSIHLLCLLPHERINPLPWRRLCFLKNKIKSQNIFLSASPLILDPSQFGFHTLTCADNLTTGKLPYLVANSLARPEGLNLPFFSHLQSLL